MGVGGGGYVETKLDVSNNTYCTCKLYCERKEIQTYRYSV
jgi:hypothetical protein